MTDREPSEAALEERRIRLRFSMAWLVPVAALLIALGVAYNTYSERGPIIEILFDDAAGIKAGETLVKYKDFNIGIVESIDLTENLRQVTVHVRLKNEPARYVDVDSKFWLVRAAVGPQGITGLDTVLSGAYIETSLNVEEGEPQKLFTALGSPPLTPAGQAGTRVILRAPEGGSVSAGAPVLFKKITVGKVEEVDLTERGDVRITAFVDAPFDRRLTTATHFWNSSGFRIEFSAAGAALNVESIASLIQGGIAFDTVTSGGEPVMQGHEFQLYTTEKDARIVILSEDPAQQLEIMAEFTGTVRGLEIGSIVEYRGIPVGKVTELQAEVFSTGDGPAVSVRATLLLTPTRFGVPSEGDVRDDLLDLLEAGVVRGLRARLATSNILTGSLFVELADLDDAPPAVFDRNASPHPELPSVESSSDGIADAAQGVMARVQSLPVEAVMDGIVTLLANANRLIADEKITSAPEQVGLLLADVRTLVGHSALQQAPADLQALLASVQALIDDIAAQQMAEKLAATIDATRAAIESIGTAAEGLPGLLDEFAALTATATELPLEDLLASGAKLIDDMGAYVRSEELAAIPVSLNASVEEVRLLLEGLRTGGTVENVSATLVSVRKLSEELAAARLTASVQTVLDETRAAIGSINTASAGLPALTDELVAVARQAAGVPLDEMVASATQILASIDAFMTSEAVESVPDTLNAALDEMRGIIQDARAGGTVENVNATLVSLRQVSDELAAAELAGSLKNLIGETQSAVANLNTASAGLPALMDSIAQVTDTAAGLPLDELVASGTDVLGSIDAFLQTEEMESVPESLAAALDEVRAILAQLRDGGAVDNVNAALASADDAAAAIEAAAASLPALAARLDQVLARAEVALAGVSPGSELNRDALLLIRDVRSASRAVNDLMSALERRPNSVLFGR